MPRVLAVVTVVALLAVSPPTIPASPSTCVDIDRDGTCADVDCDDANPDCALTCTDDDDDGVCDDQDSGVGLANPHQGGESSSTPR